MKHRLASSLILLVSLAGLTLSARLASPPDAARADAPQSASQSGAQPPPPLTLGRRPVRAIERALIISIDGLRPDLLLRANTPHLHRLFETGSYTFWAQTVPSSNTLPSHTSMLTGCSPDRHGVTWNDDREPVAYPRVPTLFEIARRFGLTTAIITGKTKFVTLAKPEFVNWASVQSAGDEKVGDEAVRILREHRPQITFVHFPGADGAGHSEGWGSPKQIEAIEKIDRQVGKLLEALDDLDLDGSTVILVSADHGGAGRTHAPNDPRARHIPWIVNGPGIRRGYDLTRNIALAVETEDTCATICHLLGLDPGDIDGKPILDVLEGENGELLRDSDKSD